MSEIYSIAQLAKEFDVTTRTIRFYEDKGLISPERRGQRRVYHPRDRVRLQLVMRGKRLGFSLEDIREMIDLYDADPTETAQLNLFLAKLQERRKSLELQRADIDTVISEIREREEQCEKLLKQKKV
jgi:DNA-binding transcriptional MerR regulator